MEHHLLNIRMLIIIIIITTHILETSYGAQDIWNIPRDTEYLARYYMNLESVPDNAFFNLSIKTLNLVHNRLMLPLPLESLSTTLEALFLSYNRVNNCARA